MSLQKYIERIKHIDSLIRNKATGTPDALAKKLHLSKAGTYKFLNEIKEQGFPIAYSKGLRSYYYTKEGRLANHLFEIRLSDDEMEQISGRNGI